MSITERPARAPLAAGAAPTRGPWDRLADHGLLLSALGAAVLGFSGLLFEESGTSSVTATTFRCLYALPVLWLLCRYERRRGGPFWTGSRAMAWFAGAFLAADLVLWLRSVDFIGAGLATVLGNVQLVFVVFASALLFGERLTARLLAGIAAMIVGVVLISGAFTAGAYGSNPLLGAALAVVAGILYGAYILLLRRSGGGGASVFPLTHATLAAALTGILIGVAFGGLEALPSLSAQGWLVTMALSGQVLAWLLLTVPAGHLPPSATSLILTLQPIAGILGGVLILGERPTAPQLLGVLVLVAGFVVAIRNRRPPMPEPQDMG